MATVGQALYDVSDPVHPRLLCDFFNTSVHLFTGDTFTYLRPAGAGTQVVLHSMGSGNESVVATFPLDMYTPYGGYAAYLPDGSVAATVTQDGPDGDFHVVLASQRSAVQIRSFPLPIADCICRFGLTPFILSFSPDGQYLVSGWPIGKGGALAQLEVQRVADQAVVATLDPAYAIALWSRAGHTLYVTGGFLAPSNGAAVWTPETGVTPLAGSTFWSVEPGLSPDTAFAAYTAYTDFAVATSIRIYVYDFAGKKTRLLIDRLRSEVVFVKDAWVWYREEVVCGPSDSCPATTKAGTQVFAMNLSLGTEVPVVFAPGESPDALQSGWGPGEFWPNS